MFKNKIKIAGIILSLGLAWSLAEGVKSIASDKNAAEKNAIATESNANCEKHMADCAKHDKADCPKHSDADCPKGKDCPKGSQCHKHGMKGKAKSGVHEEHAAADAKTETPSVKAEESVKAKPPL